ncbi:MAG: PD-(D/E)XK nuclease family protein [Eubacteriales bacterium]|nr:PD-(D/E)XK nuclease family protein [Eubacteriales bacterium]
MQLRLLLGTNQAERTALTARQISEALEQPGDAPVYLIVPEQFTLQAEQAMLSQLGRVGFIRLRIMSPSRFAREIFGRTQTPLRTLVDRRGLAMVFTRVAQNALPELQVYGRLTHYSGFAKVFLQFMDRMKQCDVQPDDLRDAQTGDGMLLKAKLQDMALLCEAMQDHLDQHQYMDQSDQLGYLLGALAADPSMADSVAYFDGFSYFTPRECRLVETLMQLCRQVNVSLAYPRQEAVQDIYEPMLRIGRRLTQSAKESGVPVQAVRSTETPAGLCDVLPWAFSGREMTRLSAQHGELTVVSASDQHEEIEACAAYISYMVRTQGAHYRDFMIACGNVSALAAQIRHVFAEYEIPCFLDTKRSALHNPVIRFLSQCLRAVSFGYAWQDMVDLSKTGLLRLEEDACEALQAYAMRFAPNGRRRWTTDFTWGAGEYDLSALNDTRRKVAFPLSFLQMKGGKQTGEAWAEALFQMLCGVEAREYLEELSEYQRQSGYFDEAALSQRIWNTLLEIFDQFYEIFRDEMLDTRQVMEILLSSLEETQVGILPTSSDEVIVGDVGRSKHVQVPYLILLGAQDGALSAIESDESVLSEREMQELMRGGVSLESDSELLTQQKRFDLFSLLSACTQRLYFSWCALDDATQSVQPDRLVTRLMELCNQGPSDILSARRLIERPVRSDASAGTLSAAIRGWMEGKTPSALQKSLLVWYLENRKDDSRIRRILSAAAADTAGESQVAARLMETLPTISVTQLEAYADCPRAYALSHVLKPVLLREHGVDPARAGTYLHAAMEEFGRSMQALSEDFSDVKEDDALRIMEQVTEKLESEFEYGMLQSTYTLRWSASAMNGVLRTAAGTWLRQMKKGSFVPLGEEIRFGRAGFPSVNLGEEDKRTELIGRIDRVDVMRDEGCDYIRIIDYKSGSLSLRPRDALNGRDLQTWLYLYALQGGWKQTFSKEGRAAAAYLFPLKNPWEEGAQGAEAAENQRKKDLRPVGWCVGDEAVLQALDSETKGKGASDVAVNSVLPVDTANEIIDLVAQDARETVRKIRSGELQTYPWRDGKNRACDFCQWRGSCSFGLYEQGTYRALTGEKRLKKSAPTQQEKDNGLE